MGTQFIDFTTGGATGDSNDTNQAAVKPIADGDPANAATFNRMPENLRTRTEVIRQALNDLKYLTDADRAQLLSGGGTVTWGGAKDVTVDSVLGTGVFTTTSNLVVRPFMAPLSSTRAKAVISGPGTDTLTVAFNTNGPHAHGFGLGGAHQDGNAYTIKFVLGASYGSVISGTPANDITITFVSGTTTAGLRALMAADSNLIAIGLDTTSTGTAAITVVSDTHSTNTLPASVQKIVGAVDAERHVVTPAAFSTFFASAANKLADGDVIGIYYDSLFDGSGGGRREAVPDYGTGAGVDKTLVGTSGSLFNLRVNPERAPLAIPLCTVSGDNLVWLNQVTVVRNQPQAGLSAGFVQRSGDTMTGRLTVSAPFLNEEENILTIVVPELNYSGGPPVSGLSNGISVLAGTGNGVLLSKTGGSGSALTIAQVDGSGDAVTINYGGESSAIAIQSTGVAACAISIGVATAASVVNIMNSGTGPAFVAKTNAALAEPTTGVTAYIEGKNICAALLKVRPSGSTSGVAGIGIDVVAPLGTTGLEGTGVQILSSGVSRSLVVINDSNVATKPAAAIVTGPSENASGFALQVGGRNVTSYSGVGAALTINATGGSSNALLITPQATALPGTPASGAIGTESFTSGAVTRSRTRAGIGNGDRSGTRVTLLGTSSAGVSNWQAMSIGTPLYYWIDSEGVVHIRGWALSTVSTSITSAGNPPSIQIIANGSPVLMPDGARPTAEAACPVVAVGPTPGFTVVNGYLFEVNADGTLWVRGGIGVATAAITQIRGISLDYPLW